MTSMDVTGPTIHNTMRSKNNEYLGFCQKCTSSDGYIVGCNRISQRSIEGIAVEKFKSCGLGITFKDIQIQFRIKKPRAQRSLKHFHDKGVLFTAQSLISQGIFIIQNTNPQQYFPSCIRAEIIENLKNSVPVEATGVNLPKDTLNQGSSSKHASSSSLENQKAQSFLDVLIQLQYVPLHIHKFQLTLHVNKEYYNQHAYMHEKIHSLLPSFRTRHVCDMSIHC
jgi:hypothetical protein